MTTPHYFTEDGMRRIENYVHRGEEKRVGSVPDQKYWPKPQEIAVFRCTEATNETAIDNGGDWPITIKARRVSTLDGYLFSDLATGCDNGGGSPGGDCPYPLAPSGSVCSDFSGPYQHFLACGTAIAYWVDERDGHSFTLCQRWDCLIPGPTLTACDVQPNVFGACQDPSYAYIPCGCCASCDVGRDCVDRIDEGDEGRDESNQSVILGLQEFDVRVGFMVGCPLKHEHFLAINRGNPDGQSRWYGFGYRHFAICGPKSSREEPDTLIMDAPCAYEIPFVYLNNRPPSPLRDPGNRHLATWSTALRKYVVAAFACQDEDCDDIAELIG